MPKCSASTRPPGTHPTDALCSATEGGGGHSTKMKPRRNVPKVTTFPGAEWMRPPPTSSTGASVGLSTRSTTSGRMRICSPAH
eukprot:7324024-Pyramimonas_sp.AAC.1